MRVAHAEIGYVLAKRGLGVGTAVLTIPRCPNSRPGLLHPSACLVDVEHETCREEAPSQHERPSVVHFIGLLSPRGHTTSLQTEESKASASP
jgi:hypothetical protein